MAQPGQRLLLQLAHPFGGQTERISHLLQGAKGMVAQTIAGHDDPLQAVGQLAEKCRQSFAYQDPICVAATSGACRGATSSATTSALQRSASRCATDSNNPTQWCNSLCDQ